MLYSAHADSSVLDPRPPYRFCESASPASCLSRTCLKARNVLCRIGQTADKLLVPYEHMSLERLADMRIGIASVIVYVRIPFATLCELTRTLSTASKLA
jgi:hypothetical protein